MLTDTHAHLDFPDYADDLQEVLERANAAGIGRIITIGTTLEGSRQAIALAERYPQVWAVVGVHPNAAAEAPEDVISPLRDLARHPRVVAIGETGMDYYRLPSGSAERPMAPDLPALGNEPAHAPELTVRDGAIKAAQIVVFQQQLDLAVELGLNVVIHERAAWEDTVAALKPYAGKVRAVFHCFGGTLERAQEVIADGHLVSFTGIVTFKNGQVVRDTAAGIPEDSYMVETDCPFLAPVPHRGKRCEPAFVREIAQTIADSRGTSLEAIAAETERTANAFFRFR